MSLILYYLSIRSARRNDLRFLVKRERDRGPTVFAGGRADAE
jgi:hypothetical protein